MKTRALVEKYFGGIPRADPPRREVAPPIPLAAEKRVTIQDAVQLPRLYLAWQTPRAYAGDDAALELLGDILSSGKSSRLQKRLVMEERIAQSAMAVQQSEALAGMFFVVVTPKPGTRLDKLRAAVDEEIARIATDGPTAEELQRAKNRIEAQVIFSLEPVGGFGGRAAHLNEYHWDRGDPGYLGKDLERYRAVTPADVRSAAATWLANDRRVVLTVTPQVPAPPAPPRHALAREGGPLMRARNPAALLALLAFTACATAPAAPTPRRPRHRSPAATTPAAGSRRSASPPT